MIRIGITPLMDMERDSYWLIPGYMKMITEEGALPLMLPLTSDEALLSAALDGLDGIVLTGGQDVSPSLYGEEKKETCGRCAEMRDAMEKTLLRMAEERDLPLLGICRGLQIMNAVYGGSLYQDLPTEYESSVEHEMKPPYNRGCHEVRLEKGRYLHTLLQRESISVNSRHHQAIRRLAPPLEALAYSEDGLIEAIRLPGKRFFLGVQWHPELLYETDEATKTLLHAFLESARGEKA